MDVDVDVDVDVPIIPHQISVIFQYFVTKKLVPDEIILFNKYSCQYRTLFQNHVNIELYFKIMITVRVLLPYGIENSDSRSVQNNLWVLGAQNKPLGVCHFL